MKGSAMTVDSEADSPDSAKQKLSYTREWNTVDFVGKYHLSKFKNKETSLPGTQVQVERDHITGKIEQAREREEYLAARAKKTAEMLRVKGESAEMNTRIYFDTIVGQPMEQAEAILNERENLLYEVPAVLDSQKDIDRFVKNVSLGRHHYVGFAASAGFRSINYAEPIYGNTALHIAVRKGHVTTTEELLKYNADMDVFNRLGNRPLHECWFFWQTHANRTAEERIAQETTTCELLLKLLSYGACPDSQDQQGQTPLHIACRLGPTRAVKIILSFQANMKLKTRAGLTAIDVALKHGHEESYKLLVAWEHISHQLVQVDFHGIWHRFLCDYSQVISSHKSAAAILAEIDMSCSVRHMERKGKEGMVQIDDPLLRAAYDASRLCEKTPKPWEAADWKEFVKLKQESGTLDLKSQLENLQRQMKGFKVKKGTGKLVMKTKQVSTTPDKPVPPPKPRKLLPISEASQGGAGGAGSASGGGGTAIASSGGYGGKGAHSTTTAADVRGFDNEGSDQEGDLGGDEAEEEHEEDAVPVRDVYAVKRTDYGQIQDFAATQLGQRRLHLAHKVALDAKFLTFTKRLTTSSALLLPLRTPHAPHLGTEEEGSRMRAIVSQGPDYEKFEKYKTTDKFAEMVGIRKVPKKSVLGAYAEECAFSKPNDRDALYERLELTNAEKLATLALASVEDPSRDPTRLNSRASSRPGTSDSKGRLSRPGTSSLLGAVSPLTGQPVLRAGKAIIDVEKRDKIDLVKDSRPRYVAADLLPSTRAVSLVEEMSRKEDKRQADLLRKKQGLGTEHGVAAARELMEQAIAAGAAGMPSSAGDDGLGGMGEAIPDEGAAGGFRRKQAAEKAVAMRHLFLQKEVPKYGEGRITSTHNTKGKIEEPWVTTKGRHTTIAGDRTA